MPAQTDTAPIRYRVDIHDAHAHLFRVRMVVATPDRGGQRLWLPTWIPGSYLVREFARHIVRIEARCGSRKIALRKLDKNSWRAGRCSGALHVEYDVYANDLSVRGAHLDGSHAFFNGTSLLLAAAGFEHAPHELELRAPRTARANRTPPQAGDGWRVATAMPALEVDADGFGRYRAPDYDALIDHPVEIGRFVSGAFDAGGARHEIAVTGRTDVDIDRLGRDLARICRAQIALFEPRSRRAPIDRYVFLATAVGSGYGGLEHRASTALLCARADLPHAGLKGVPEGYRRFLGLASHEYFHTWWVKRVKPQAFAPYALANESYTRLLWVFEGFTSYYDDLMLARAGLIDAAAYLSVLAETISRVYRDAGQRVQSVAESSFDAWIKFYRQDENAPNAIASYYAKGALVALAIDLALRSRSGHRRSLDDVLRLAWKRYGRDFARSGQGLPEDAMPALVRDATGIDLRREIAAWAYGTRTLPLARLLAPFGVELDWSAADQTPFLGLRTATHAGDLTVTTVLSDSPAMRAGLSAGDVIIAADGLRVDEQTLKAWLARRGSGSPVRLHLFRRDELIEVAVEPAPPPRVKATLAISGGRTAAARRRRWLGR
ncbi:MAG: M61 family metallopeptidase [Burkholderiales bacterium]|nr:MAG: M61 family metallopeptidase [Burkholderiales bacterium]